MRRQKLHQLASLGITINNEKKLRDEFEKNKLLWDNLSTNKVDVLIQRWKDKKLMKEEEWYQKYKLQFVYSDYKSISKTLSLKDNRYKFWFYQSFLSKYF